MGTESDNGAGVSAGGAEWHGETRRHAGQARGPDGESNGKLLKSRRGGGFAWEGVRCSETFCLELHVGTWGITE